MGINYLTEGYTKLERSANVEEPAFMFGAYVTSFSSSVGYGAESSTLQMSVIEDPNREIQKKNDLGELLYLGTNAQGEEVETTDAVDSNGDANTKIMVPSPVTIHYFEPVRDSDGVQQKNPDGTWMVTRVDGFPPVGTACQFKFQGFEFAGIFQRHSYKEDSGGRVYDLVFESPSKALDGVQVIMSDFTGSVFQENNMLNPAGYKQTIWDDPSCTVTEYIGTGGSREVCGYSCNDVLGSDTFTSQIRNVYNPFGILANYKFVWGDGNDQIRSRFSWPNINKYGIALMGENDASGSDSPYNKGLLTLIQEISESKYKYRPYTLDTANTGGVPANNANSTSPFGTSYDPDPDAYVVQYEDKKEVIGGPVHYGMSLMTIDMSDLKTAISTHIPNKDFLRMKGPVQSVQAIVQEACDFIVHDYVVTLDLVKDIMPNGSSDEPTITNGVIPQKYREDDPEQEVVGPAIRFKLLNKQAAPEPGAVKDLIDEYRQKPENERTLQSSTHGTESSNVVTQKLLLGGKASRIWEALSSSHLIPAYGKRPDGSWIVGTGFDDATTVEVWGEEGAQYTDVTVLELRCALASEEAWTIYRQLCQEFGISTVTSPFTSRLTLKGLRALNKVAKGTWSWTMASSGFSGEQIDGTMRLMNTSDATDNVRREDSRWNAVSNVAQNYFGKTYFIMLPTEPGALDNNIRYLNEEEYDFESAWEIADSGWDPEFRAKGSYNDVYTTEGKLKACAGYRVETSTAAKMVDVDLSGLGATFPLQSRGGYGFSPDLNFIGTSSVQVESQIFYQDVKSLKHLLDSNGDLKYDPCNEHGQRALVHITCPQVLSNDMGNALWSAMKNIGENLHEAMGAGMIGGSASDWDNGFQRGIQIEPGDNLANVASTWLSQIRGAPKVKHPTIICIPQESNMYTWGPWYSYGKGENRHFGKAAVEQDTNLRPEVFGSASSLDKAAFSLVNADTADMYASESGSITLAEFPQYNIADRFNANGPYITKMDVSVGTNGLTTSYSFSTWTRKFGKIAKYNVTRMADINKNRIKRLREGLPPGRSFAGTSGSSTFASDKSNNDNIVRSRRGMNFFSGFAATMQRPENAGAAANPLATHKTYWDMSGVSSDSLHVDFAQQDLVNPQTGKRYTDAEGGPKHTYDRMFGCTPEQIFSPVGVRLKPNDGRVNDQNSTTGLDDLPYILLPTKSKPLADAGEESDTKGRFYQGNVIPTSMDLDPYYGAQRENGVIDFGATCIGDVAWLTENGGEGRNIHIQNNDGKIPVAANGESYLRTYGLRGPILLSGWGYDVCGLPAPSINSSLHMEDTLVNPAKNRSVWKTGPVDLMWDDERQVWSGGLKFLEGKLTSAIEPAESLDEPTTATMEVYRRNRKATQRDNKGVATAFETKWDNVLGDEITITNRDPSLSVDPGNASYDIYVMVARINYEWRIVYISCDNA